MATTVGKPGLRFDLGPEHPEVAIQRLIAEHVGAAQAVTIEAIAVALWPSEWWFVGRESHGMPEYPHRAKLQRVIKKWVRSLRRKGIKIAPCRGKPPGYYMISNAKELSAAVRPLLRQALDELKTIEALTGKGYYSRELAGQMQLDFGT